MPIDSLKQFINQNKHLPIIPSEKEIKTNGFEMADMQAKLLQQVEELTLYIIQLDETNKRLENRINALEGKD